MKMCSVTIDYSKISHTWGNWGRLVRLLCSTEYIHSGQDINQDHIGRHTLLGVKNGLAILIYQTADGRRERNVGVLHPVGNH